VSFIPYQSQEPGDAHQLARQFVNSLQVVPAWNYPGYQSHKNLIDLQTSSLVLASANHVFYQSSNTPGANRWLFPVQKTSDLRLPSRLSFFNITPNYIEVSTIKKTETRDSIILRFWNPKSTIVNVVIGVGLGYTEVWKCLLNENRVSLLNIEPNTSSFPLEIRQKSIVTLEFV